MNWLANAIVETPTEGDDKWCHFEHRGHRDTAYSRGRHSQLKPQRRFFFYQGFCGAAFVAFIYFLLISCQNFLIIFLHDVWEILFLRYCFVLLWLLYKVLKDNIHGTQFKYLVHTRYGSCAHKIITCVHMLLPNNWCFYLVQPVVLQVNQNQATVKSFDYIT